MDLESDFIFFETSVAVGPSLGLCLVLGPWPMGRKWRITKWKSLIWWESAKLLGESGEIAIFFGSLVHMHRAIGFYSFIIVNRSVHVFEKSLGALFGFVILGNFVACSSQLPGCERSTSPRRLFLPLSSLFHANITSSYGIDANITSSYGS